MSIFDDLEKIRAPETAFVSTSKSEGIAIRKPRSTEWFRTSPDHKAIAVTVYLDDDRTYLVMPKVASDPIIAGVAKTMILYVVCNRSNECFLSPVGISDNDWHVTKRDGHQQANTRWVRLCSNTKAGRYDLVVAEFDEVPAFPLQTYGQLLESAFGQNIISSLDHPVARNLHGKNSD